MAAHDDTGGVSRALASARPEDPAGRVLARARVEAALFGAATAALGRFHVIERLGRGGMGVVYAAYDPELDRSVALKMVHVPERGRELAVAEAKALARLSHPNVVPVFDVGVIDDHVYIVMEHVRGASLREWVRGKSPREIVGAYLQAGQALAAAHAAGLIHRDFKPDNAIAGADGRVRVVDFGLACEASAGLAGAGSVPARAGAGTPRYMAPEQAAGAVTPAVDQYSFCASLGEALREGGHAPPRWLAELLERGRAADPRARFGSMGELLRALGRDPARVWRWRVGAAAVAIATGAAFLIGRGRIGAELEPCSGGARELAAAWSPDAQRAELTRVARFGGYGVEVAARLEARLVDHGARWVAHHREACLAHRRGEQSAALLDRRMVCLARSRAALAAVAEVAATTAGVGALPDLARAAAALPDPAACADPAALTADSEPPPPVLAPRLAVLRGALEGARVQLAAGRARVAGDVARSVASEASGLGYAPLLAEARLIEGTAAMRSAPDRASAALAEAVAAGLAHRADAIAVEAWARRAWSAWIEGRRGDPVAALAGLDVMDALAARTPTARFARALLHNNAGSLALARGRRDEARAALERAQRAAVGVTGPGAVELVAIRRNLALVIDDPVARDRVAAAAELDLARLLGADHPDTLLTRYLRAGASVVRAEAARAMLEATCERFALHERLEPLRAPCEVELADLRDLLGDRAGAAAAYARAMRAPDPETLEAAGHVARLRGDPAGALAALESALRTLAASDAPGQWYVRAKLYLAQGLALREAGRLAEAAVALDRALVAAASVAPGAPLAQERRVARARAELAEVLAASRSQPARARELARAAASWYRAAGIAAPRLDELAAEPAGPP